MCIFCGIVNKKIPSYKIYEDDDLYAFLDINPANYGHTLVISKNHYETIFDLDLEVGTKLFKKVIELSKVIKEILGVEGVNIINNSGVVANQTVNHFHVHIIPRVYNDSVVIKADSLKLTEEEFKNIQLKIQNGIA